MGKIVVKNCHTIIFIILYLLFGNVLKTLIRYYLQEVNFIKPTSKGYRWVDTQLSEKILVVDKFKFKVPT